SDDEYFLDILAFRHSKSLILLTVHSPFPRARQNLGDYTQAALIIQPFSLKTSPPATLFIG
ncbi:MAG: hypothetical protein ACYSPI_01745, partial [Planctomycetota bacterium]